MFFIICLSNNDLIFIFIKGVVYLKFALINNTFSYRAKFFKIKDDVYKYLKSTLTPFKFDFSKIDELLPHPVYAWMGWMMILTPKPDTLNSIWVLIQESYLQAVEKFSLRVEN